MSAYYILTQTITDPERYAKEYIPGISKFLAKYGAEVLAADPQATPLQGNPASGVVIIKFPSEASIQAFVNDPDYQPLKEIRLSSTTNAAAVMTPEFNPHQ
ncbi:MAG: DUF1330 domain-containing protein [Chloroflexota bacterium]